MKILVIDDTQVHLDAAVQQLGKDHDLTVCSSHEEAYRLLGEQYADTMSALKEKYKSEGMDNWKAYEKAESESKLPYWDAVLTDLLMPAGKMAQGGEGLKYVGQEMAVGWSLALRAAKMGAKCIAVVTDMDHHHHPASAMLDNLDGHIFEIEGAKMLLTNHVGIVGITGTECSCTECGGSGKKSRTDGSTYDCYYCKNGIDFSKKGKNWEEILSRFTKASEGK